MAVTVEKRSKAKVRQQKVAHEFQIWLANNPKATSKQKCKQLDAISDSAMLSEELSKIG